MCVLSQQFGIHFVFFLSVHVFFNAIIDQIYIWYACTLGQECYKAYAVARYVFHIFIYTQIFEIIYVFLLTLLLFLSPCPYSFNLVHISLFKVFNFGWAAL